MECMKIWVYGSLLEGAFNYKKVLVGKVVFRTRGRVRGKLFHQSEKGYPALLPGDDWVEGEVLELVDFPRTVKALDELENYFGSDAPDNEYDRLVTPVFLPDSNIWTDAHVYWYGRDDLGTPDNPAVPVPGGDWRVYIDG